MSLYMHVIVTVPTALQGCVVHVKMIIHRNNYMLFMIKMISLYSS